MFIYIIVLLLILVLRIIILIFLWNHNLVIIRFKLFKSISFFDLEIIYTSWNFIFLFLVLIITLSVRFFSFSYIRVYPIQNFFMLYIGFVLRILWLILNSNFYWIIFGWDGLGVVSFLLIVYYGNFERVTNGLFTIFQNRFGDLFFVLFVVLVLSTRNFNRFYFFMAGLCLILGACVKRAQYPFNSWLLAAMRAPTPISSLVHSSTLVVAGVYILLQYSYVFIGYLTLLKYLRMLTLVLSLFGLINERDIKKLIAYSTMRHVGLILFLLRVQLYKVTYFHLNIHAIFKSLMFMCFGFTILHSYHAQDKRLVTYINITPLVKIFYYFACFCLIGLPFLRGFFSKDFIIEKTIEISVEMRDVFLLILFLRVRIYYRIKLLKLYQPVNTIFFNETQILGMCRLLLITVLIICMTNLFIRIIFRVRLELLSLKLVIYLFILSFLFLSILTNLNFKWLSYRKIFNMQELWIVNWYYLDQFMYSTIINVTFYTNVLNQIKYIVLVNWWVLILIVVVF